MRITKRTTIPRGTEAADAPGAADAAGPSPTPPAPGQPASPTPRSGPEPGYRIPTGALDLADSIPIADVVWRHRAQVGGRVRSVRTRPWGDHPTLECVVADATGAVTVAFLGRRQVAGIRPGGWLTVEGMVGERNGKLLILNPAYDLRPLD